MKSLNVHDGAFVQTAENGVGEDEDGQRRIF